MSPASTPTAPFFMPFSPMNHIPTVSRWMSSDVDADGCALDSEEHGRSECGSASDGHVQLDSEMLALDCEGDECHSKSSDNSLKLRSSNHGSVYESASDGASDSGSTDEDHEEAQTHRVLRIVLAREFNIELGQAEPPSEAVDAAADFLSRVHKCVRQFQPRLVDPGVRARAVQMQGDGRLPNGQGNDRDRDVGDRASKRPRVDDAEEYPCPFRMKKPWRFNIREFDTCAKARFKTLSEVKKHIRQAHACEAGFTQELDWRTHMTADPQNVCVVRPESSLGEEAVSREVAELLRSRSEHFDWERLWQTLFPQSEGDVPQPIFHHIIELPEVEREFESRLPGFQVALHSHLDKLLSRSMVDSLISGWDTTNGREDGPRDFVFHTLEALFEDSVEAVFQGTRDKAFSSSPPLRPQSGSPAKPVVEADRGGVHSVVFGASFKSPYHDQRQFSQRTLIDWKQSELPYLVDVTLSQQ
ncbi:hypothetical protein QBC34DRAFT_499432 [Podospora aff. communis PSN243]|uniref:Uncharacterized protein n=1 Tax=Podospora aff. communis PSN243 TaxID=3040156 RepID=A0AAV9G3M2_9PEZI|nr:hypothetical protein QBC34DRAFT_499432 [Podospora aff. communis PSN243]